MALISSLEIARDLKVKKNARVRILWVLAACFALLVPYPMLSSAWGAFPCEDVNNNGVCDDGESDVTAQILDDGIFHTSESLVIPAGANLSTRNRNGFVLIAEKNITVNADLSAGHRDAPVYLIARNGTINVGDGAELRAGQIVMLDARGDIVVGSHSSLHARYDSFAMVMVHSSEGAVTIQGSELYGPGSVNISSEGANVTVLDSQLRTLKGEGRIVISAAGDIDMDGNETYGELVRVVTKGSLLAFQNNQVQVPTDGGLVLLVAYGSTVDITGSEFKHLDADDLIIRAATVLP